jgi:crotonobetaine/carnitine-CoA ligase
MIGTMSTSFAGAVADRAEARPDGEVVRLAGSPGWTAATLWQRSLAIAGGLARVVDMGDAVATCLPAGPEAIAVTTALSVLGAVELPLGQDIGERWARTLARAAGCVTAVTTSDALRESPFLGQLGRHATVPVVGGRIPLDELVEEGRPVTPRRRAPGDPALIMTTSGTIGRVKGALLPVAAGPGQAARVQRAIRYDAADVLYNFFPWNHINARHAAFLPAVISGARLVVDRTFSASRFVDVVRAEGITAFNFMGAVCAILPGHSTEGAA